MPKSKIRYIFTWVAFVTILICSILLTAVSWNGIVTSEPSPSLMILLWVLISAAGIYLFMLAVKKTHRELINEVRSLNDKDGQSDDKTNAKKNDYSKDNQELDFSATARKLVRRIPENASLEDVGKELLKNLARELEIMSGVFYLHKKSKYVIESTYAVVAQAEPYSFEIGEGLTGQVARNQQLMVLTRLPEEYLEVHSGLGKSRPTYLAIVPLVYKNRTVAIVECSGYRYDPHDIESMFRVFSRDLMEKISPNLT